MGGWPAVRARAEFLLSRAPCLPSSLPFCSLFGVKAGTVLVTDDGKKSLHAAV